MTTALPTGDVFWKCSRYVEGIPGEMFQFISHFDTVVAVSKFIRLHF